MVFDAARQAKRAPAPSEMDFDLGNEAVSRYEVHVHTSPEAAGSIWTTGGVLSDSASPGRIAPNPIAFVPVHVAVLRKPKGAAVVGLVPSD